MALAKDRASCSFYGSYMLESPSPSPLQFPNLSSINPSSPFYHFEDDHYQKQLTLQGDDSDSSTNNNNMGKGQQVQGLVSHSSPLSSSSSANSSNGFGIHGGGSSYQQPEEAHSLINFKAAAAIPTFGGGFMQTNGSLLSFQPQSCYSFGQPNDYPMWEASSPHDDHHHQNHQLQLKMKGAAVGGGDFRVLDDVNCLQTTTSGGYQDATGEWLYGEGPVAVDRAQESAAQQQTSFTNKRPLMEEENMQTLKKQCTSPGSSRKQPIKPKPSSSPPKDPQSIAAKNRRERISERLKILQDLVPNGSKVDLVTMLEKAIGYVKFLQLQVKVLATDEFWPAAGGKAPDIAQVREAIDAILSTQRDTPSSSKQ